MFSWFEKRINPYPANDAVLPPKGLFAFCWHYSRHASPWLLMGTILVALIAVGEVLLYSFMGDIVDFLTNSDPATFFEENSSTLWLMGIVVVIGLPIISTLHGLVTHQTLLGSYPMSIRWLMHRRLLQHSMSFFADEFAGRVATKVMQTSLAVREAVMKILDTFVYVVVQFLAMIVLLVSIDWRLSIIFLVWFVIYATLLMFFVPKLKVVSQAQADARSIMTGRIVDSYTNIGTVKLFSHAGRELSYAKDSMNPFLVTVFKQMRLVTKLDLGVTYNNNLLLFLVAAVSIWFWSLGNISIGAIAVGIALALRLNGLSHWIMWELAGFFEQVGVVQDGINMLTKPVEINDMVGAKSLKAKVGTISYKDVRFHYGKETGVIENLSLDIKAGEKIGLVGRSGAGKTTLVNLLLRYFDLENGQISVDGIDISTVTQDSLRSQIGMVSQDTSLLHRSVRDNIAYGKPDASDEEILDAARRANALEFISGLEDMKGRKGLDAHVGERGVKLSGGQRQRIAIARVFLKDAPILVLDEATSALDSEVEAAIQENLFELMQGKTVIAIAHRLSTISAMDRLIVLDQGAILEEGSHDELVAKGGIYSDLWSRQSGGFINIDEKQKEAGE
ncbi:MAG: ABC transporter ATP-binding protein [Rhizobiaceae bacterium]|nr:ABC transporter ATP-binding protein [Rhizobiaceae bacterium]